jgi:hypothetical protein
MFGVQSKKEVTPSDTLLASSWLAIENPYGFVLGGCARARIGLA